MQPQLHIVNILNKSYEQIFSEFADADAETLVDVQRPGETPVEAPEPERRADSRHADQDQQVPAGVAHPASSGRARSRKRIQLRPRTSRIWSSV